MHEIHHTACLSFKGSVLGSGTIAALKRFSLFLVHAEPRVFTAQTPKLLSSTTDLNARLILFIASIANFGCQSLLEVVQVRLFLLNGHGHKFQYRDLELVPMLPQL